MANAEFNSMIKWIVGKLGRLVYRRSHNGKVSVYPAPNMTKVKWSPAQVTQRERIAEANAYSKAARAVPELHAYYTQMSLEQKNNKRPHDMAVKDYFAGHNLLGDKFHWDVEHWRDLKRHQKRKKR